MESVCSSIFHLVSGQDLCQKAASVNIQGTRIIDRKNQNGDGLVSAQNMWGTGKAWCSVRW